jgi:hypothetical protein
MLLNATLARYTHDCIIFAVRRLNLLLIEVCSELEIKRISCESKTDVNREFVCARGRESKLWALVCFCQLLVTWLYLLCYLHLITALFLCFLPPYTALTETG